MAENKKKQKSGGIGVLKLLVLLFVVVVIAAVGYGLTLEENPHFERSVVIDADKDDIHAMVGDLKQWDKWGPWRDEDPTIKYAYTEKTDEVGSKQTWTADKIGGGSLWFTKVDPETGVKYKFQYEEFEPSDGSVTYTETEDGKVKVTWAFDAELGWNLPMRFIMDSSRGDMETMFQNGLNKLKKQVENN